MSDGIIHLLETALQENYSALISKIDTSGEIQIFYSLSDLPKVVEKVENNRDITRMAFTVMTLSACISCMKNDTDEFDKIRKAFDFIVENKKHIKDKTKRVFAELYMLEAAIHLYGDKKIINHHLKSFKESFSKLKNNKYKHPLLVNKIISFYEEFGHVVDLSDMEQQINNFKSVMLYVISSDLSNRFPFFHFADMLVWSKGTSFNDKVIQFIEKKTQENNLQMVSSSGLAYLLECQLRSGLDLNENLFKIIDKCKLTESELHMSSADRPIPYGLYLNSQYQNFACLDTNTHLLLGLVHAKK